jgi:P pilus assembly chaperone PapD
MCKQLNYYLLFVMLALPSYALEVTPMVVTFSPNSTSNGATSLVHNQLPRDIAFDVQVYEIQFTQGGPQLVPLEDSPLWVFPPSLFLPAGQSQRIQFRWLDKVLPSADKSYQVSLIEQPINAHLADKSSQLTMLLNVNLIVHVDQPQLVAELVAEEPYLEGTDIMVNITNKGSGASRLSDYEIKVIDNSNGSMIFSILKQKLKAQGYDVFFAPNSTQQIKIPKPKSIKESSLKSVRLELVR